METIPSYLQDPGTVLQVANMPQYKIKSEEVEEMRAFHRRAVVAEMIDFKT
jgi:hypothetical protein